VAIALPGLVLLHLLRGTIETMEKQGDQAPA
jgi:PAT family beta-lactamase induction signal transducer AmpG